MADSDEIFGRDTDWMFWPATRPDPASAWLGHIPFAHWLVGAACPSTVVELGTHVGASYAALCEGVQRNGLPARCWAVDTWLGDDQSGRYDEAVFTSLDAFNKQRYGGFSTLLRKTFDTALGDFADGSIDLLHIDGLHTYDAVRHDFEAWRPKLSARALVLFHDTIERQPGFGVWKLWEELGGNPRFEFQHAHGLGVMQMGPDMPRPLAPLFEATPAVAASIRQRFQMLGERYEISARLWIVQRRAERLDKDLRAASAGGTTG